MNYKTSRNWLEYLKLLIFNMYPYVTKQIEQIEILKTLVESNEIDSKLWAIVSSQISTVPFEAGISPSTQISILEEVINSGALSKHSKIFSQFYVNMVKSGEESGKLDETFLFLADYLDRTYEISSKARNALIYPAFVFLTFIVVMVLMLTLVIPKIGNILTDSGQELPLYTKAVVALADFFVNYGIFLLALLAVGGFFTFRWVRTAIGRTSLDRTKISVPALGNLYTKLYLSRIADNLSTMLSSGIPMIRAIEITASVVDNAVYEQILTKSVQSIKAGSSVSETLGQYPEIPGIMIQMIKVGEETGELGNILKTLSKFYRREVENAVDTLVNLIEPIMIVMLALGVGVLLASVLMPIYNISSAI